MSDPRYLRPGFDFAVAHVIEECGEVQAAMGKMLRWGPLSVNPELPPSEQETNLAWVKREMDDLQEAIGRFYAEVDRLEAPTNG